MLSSTVVTQKYIVNNFQPATLVYNMQSLLSELIGCTSVLQVSDSSTSEMGLEERASEHVVPTSLKAGSGALHTDETWRLDIAPTLPWEEFLLEVQDVMSLTKVSGKRIGLAHLKQGHCNKVHSAGCFWKTRRQEPFMLCTFCCPCDTRSG